MAAPERIYNHGRDTAGCVAAEVIDPSVAARLLRRRESTRRLPQDDISLLHNQRWYHASSRTPEHTRQHRIFRDIVAWYPEAVSR